MYVLRSLFYVLILTSFVYAQTIKTDGVIFVNGEKLTKQTKIKLGDRIETSKKGIIRFTLGDSAFRATGGSKFSIVKVGKNRVLNIQKGNVLAVFGKERYVIVTPNMKTTIKKGAAFSEVKNTKTYFCLCYGQADIEALGKTKKIDATYHNMMWISETKLKLTMDMEVMKGHTDKQLRRLEKMFGRKVPFDRKK